MEKSKKKKNCSIINSKINLAYDSTMMWLFYSIII